LDEPKIVERLVAEAEAYGGEGSLLRIYWYDASPARGLNTEHIRLAEADSVKVRLGILNDYGQQKGVDSLIIADLIELARNGAITHALLLAGDEDLRVGVQVIQTFGVRVQLVGIDTSRGTSQSRDLRREADKVTVWDEDTVRSFLSVRPLPQSLVVAAQPAAPPVLSVPTLIAPATVSAENAPSGNGSPGSNDRVASSAVQNEGLDVPPQISSTARQYAIDLSEEDATTVADLYLASGKVPYQFDSRLLATVRGALQRELTEVEKRTMRRVFVRELSDRLATINNNPDT
jgi:hypothetical protein